jgi:general L-amino acid transport system permease protein
LNYPIPIWATVALVGAGGLLLGLVLIWPYRRWARQQFEASGKLRSVFWVPVLWS